MPKLYNLDWGDKLTPLDVEMLMIQSGGYKIVRGVKYGNGLSHHYESVRKLLWPRLDDHRWHRICRDTILSNKITVLMGCASSGKTHEAAWVYLVEYFCHPQETCVLVSSTDLRGLRLRVWGEITMLWQEAIERYPHLPGHLLESRIAITTDEMVDSEFSDRTVRDMRRGVVGIPTVQNGKFVGLGKWCFPGEMLVDIPGGKKPISMIHPGDSVISAIGPSKVAETVCHYAEQLVRIHLRDGRSLDCTPDHPVLTNMGWVNAVDILPYHMVYSPHEIYTLQSVWSSHSEMETRQHEILLHALSRSFSQQNLPLWKGVRSEGLEGNILQPVLCGEVENVTTRYCQENDSWKGFRSSWKGYQSRHSSKCEGNAEEEELGHRIWRTNGRMEAVSLHGSNQGRIHPAGMLSFGDPQHESANWIQFQKRFHPLLPHRFSVAEYHVGDRSGWGLPPIRSATEKGLRQKSIPSGTRVDRVEVLKPTGDSRYSNRHGGYKVYDLQVENHPTFSVNGVVVHNCGIKQKRMRLIADEAQFMGASFLSAFANLNKNEDFRAIVIGNPSDPLDPLGKTAEPLDGWSGHLEPKKTEVWKTRFMNGACVNLIGTDSPNFDFPADQPTRYRYLISREKIADTLSFFPKESSEYYSQCVGCMKVGTLDDRIITRELCRNFGALDEAVWKGTDTIKICALDAAYGGDRAVCGHIEFGEAVNGQTVIKFNSPQIVPVSVNSTTSPEDQLATWVREYCTRNEIEPAHFFHDSTGRGGLGTAIARAWSAECNPVEFGGSATQRPVAAGLYTFDIDTQTRRPTRCDEHYDRFITEMWFQFRYCIESRQIRSMPEEVMDELAMRKWERKKNNRISVETKEKMKERIGRSPDLGDWAALCLEGARRLGFMIEKIPDSSPESGGSEDYLLRELRKYQQEKRKRQLHYT